MKTIRKLHLWLGVLFAPTIFLFAFSGALQILGLHEGKDPSPWIADLAQIHKNQRVVWESLPARPAAVDASTRRADADADHAAAPAPGADPTATGDRPAAPRPAPAPRSKVLIVFCLIMAVGLMTSTGLDIYMAFGYRRDRRVIVGLLAAGTVLPLLGLFA